MEHVTGLTDVMFEGDSIVVSDLGVRVEATPPWVRISIEFLTKIERGISIHGNMITVGSGIGNDRVSYAVVCTGGDGRWLVCRREDVDGDPPPPMLG